MMLMGVVVGGASERERRRCARGVDGTDGVTGIVVGGLGIGDVRSDAANAVSKLELQSMHTAARTLISLHTTG